MNGKVARGTTIVKVFNTSPPDFPADKLIAKRKIILGFFGSSKEGEEFGRKTKDLVFGKDYYILENFYVFWVVQMAIRY